MKKSCIKGKKGLSPVIATVLLIVLVFVLFVLIFLWMKGFLRETIEKNEQAIENICPSVNFQAYLVDGNTKLEVANRGTITIYNLEVKMIDSEGNSKIYKWGGDVIGVDVGGSIRQEISLDAGTEKVIVYPVLLGSVKGGPKTKPYTCLDMGITITIDI